MLTSIHSLKKASLAILVTLLTYFPSHAQAPVDVRIALVIGNAAYLGTAALVNTTNDAKAMSLALKDLGFTVMEVQNGSKAQMSEAITKLQASLSGKRGVGLLYFAGHGLQVDWRNYMVPVDAKLQTHADVLSQTIDLSQVIDAFKAAGSRMNILVLDACRDNPFAVSATGKGLAQFDAPAGTFLAFSTAPGNVADDGDAKDMNGLYTGFLLQELKKPQAKIEDIFKRVRLSVRQKSQGRQIPWESTSLEEDFYFSPAAQRSAAVDAKTRGPEFEIEKAAWDRIKSSSDPQDYFAFLRIFPSGAISEVAQAALNKIQKTTIATSPAKDAPQQTIGLARYRMGDAYEFSWKNSVTGVETRRAKFRVTKADENFAEMNGGEAKYTQQGADIIDASGTVFDPPITTIPHGEYQIGKKWISRSNTTYRNGGKGWIEYEIKIVALEKVTVPAGTFTAYKLDFSYTANDGSSGSGSRWHEPEWGPSIKRITTGKDRNGRVTGDTRELVSREGNRS
jgi:Caspase domain